MEMQTVRSFPTEALQHVLSFIDTRFDRNSVSLVCKSWYDIERWSRHHVFISNCYAVSPLILFRRFNNVRSITIKGKHFAADFDFVPEGWGAHALPWIAALVAVYPQLEEIRLKRMVVTNEGLELLGRKLKNLRVLVLRRCDGFSTHGLASIAANCRKLRTLDLCQSEVDDLDVNWISHFPDSYTSLEFLNIDCLTPELHFPNLERLIGICHNLKGLRLNRALSLDKLAVLLLKAPQLVDLGIGLLTMDTSPNAYAKVATAFAACKGLTSLSGLLNVNPYYLPIICGACSSLTSLNLTHSSLHSPDLVKLLRHCPNLQRLFVLDYIKDRGLEEVATSCKELQELRVRFSDPYDVDPSISLTEQGLVSIATGCPKLHTIIYCCSQMTNAALVTVAEHLPNLTCFRPAILEPQLPDYQTHQPLDDGFSAILEGCKNLKRLTVTGLVTDRLLDYIGTQGKKLEWLHLAFSGESDLGLHHILTGCSNLRKLSIRDCPFTGQALLRNSSRLEKLQSLWMASCLVSYGECKLLAKKLSLLNVEVINEKGPLHSMSDDCPVENLYVYRTLAGPRLDTPSFVWITNDTESSQLESSLLNRS